MRAVAVFLLVLSHLALCQGWTCTKGPQLKNALQVAAGMGEVVAIDKGGQSYFLIGSSWTKLPNASMLDISVGKDGIWGTNIKDKYLYKFVGGNWARMGGVWNRVDAGGDGIIALVRSTANHVYCAVTGYNPKTGQYLTGMGQSRIVSTYFLSCGPFGCWALIRRGQIVFNGGLKILESGICAFSGWSSIGGGAFYAVTVGSDGKAFAVKSPNREIMERTGITKARPYGTGWKVVPECAKMLQVTYDLGTIYGVSTSGDVMKCTA